MIKLTDQNTKSRNNTCWVVGQTVSIPEQDRNKNLCSAGILHAYDCGIELALMLNPTHGNIENPRAFEVEGEIISRDALKVGCYSLHVIREINVPAISSEAKIRFAIYCALSAYKKKTFVSWARNWLRKKDRTIASTKKMALKMEAAWAAEAAAVIKGKKINLNKLAILAVQKESKMITLKESVRAYEKDRIINALKANYGNVAATSRWLGVKLMTLWSMIRRYEIDPDAMRPEDSQYSSRHKNSY